jgi:hypothetical protein
MCNEPSQNLALARLRAQVLVRWDAFPRLDELDVLLQDALARACAKASKVITLTSAVSRPARLRLAAIGGRADLDSFTMANQLNCVPAKMDDYFCFIGAATVAITRLNGRPQH